MWAVIKEFNKLAKEKPFEHNGCRIRLGKRLGKFQTGRRVLITRCDKAAKELFDWHNPNSDWDMGRIYLGRHLVGEHKDGDDIVWKLRSRQSQGRNSRLVRSQPSSSKMMMTSLPRDGSVFSTALASVATVQLISWNVCGITDEDMALSLAAANASYDWDFWCSQEVARRTMSSSVSLGVHTLHFHQTDAGRRGPAILANARWDSEFCGRVECTWGIFLIFRRFIIGTIHFPHSDNADDEFLSACEELYDLIRGLGRKPIYIGMDANVSPYESSLPCIDPHIDGTASDRESYFIGLIALMNVWLLNTFERIRPTHTNWAGSHSSSIDFIAADVSRECQSIDICNELFGATVSDHLPLVATVKLPSCRGNRNNWSGFNDSSRYRMRRGEKLLESHPPSSATGFAVRDNDQIFGKIGTAIDTVIPWGETFSPPSACPSSDIDSFATAAIDSAKSSGCFGGVPTRRTSSLSTRRQSFVALQANYVGRPTRICIAFLEEVGSMRSAVLGGSAPPANLIGRPLVSPGVGPSVAAKAPIETLELVDTVGNCHPRGEWSQTLTEHYGTLYDVPETETASITAQISSLDVLVESNPER